LPKSMDTLDSSTSSLICPRLNVYRREALAAPSLISVPRQYQL
jgi:hypothetical protein